MCAKPRLSESARLRILIIAPMLPHGPGAMPVLLEAQLRALADRHELTLVTGIGDEAWEARAASTAISSDVDLHLADRRLPPRLRQRLRRRARPASDWAFTQRPWATLWFAAPAVQTLIDQLTATRQFDLITVEDSSMAMFRLPAHIPAVLSDYEVGRPRPPVWRPGGDATMPQWLFRELDWRRWKPFQQAAWRRYRWVQVFTDYDAQTIDRQAPDVSPRVRINPFGVVLPNSADISVQEPGSVLFVGNFTHPPNRDAATWLVREIMPRVRARYPGAWLRLVGSDPPREVRALAGERVEVRPDVPDVEPYLAAAAVCAAPVRLGGGMRMKVLYALAAGKAVVSTSRGAEGFRQADRESPMLVYDDAEQIAEAIAHLLADEGRRRELGRQARSFAREFHSPSAWGCRLDAVYEEAAATISK
jgi:glycosyltransferase involved in cell wall biosynthesis